MHMKCISIYIWTEIYTHVVRFSSLFYFSSSSLFYISPGHNKRPQRYSCDSTAHSHIESEKFKPIATILRYAHTTNTDLMLLSLFLHGECVLTDAFLECDVCMRANVCFFGLYFVRVSVWKRNKPCCAITFYIVATMFGVVLKEYLKKIVHFYV